MHRSLKHVNNKVVFIMFCQPVLVSVVVFFIILYVGAEFIFDEYAEPWEIKSVGIQYCTYKGYSCGNVTWNRRRKQKAEGEWDANATMILKTYLSKTHMRVSASTRGLNGRYNSLIDFTQPSCKWLSQWIFSLICDLGQNAGYKGSCEMILPGIYQLTNFHFKQKQLSDDISKKAPVLPYGLHKTEMKFSEEYNPDCFCIRFLLNIVPNTRTILRKQQQISQKNVKLPTSEISANHCGLE